MVTKTIYENNPLHAKSLEEVLTVLVEHYGFEILAAYLNLNCFKQKPSIESSLKFLKKTNWAQQKVEAFYMYQYHSLPKADDANFALPPRDRIVPSGLEARPPKKLNLEHAEELRVTTAKKTRERAARTNPADPWGNR
jgi:uncharacterized protein (DUF2132 family)